MSLNIARRTAAEVVILDLKGWATLGADSDRLSEVLHGEIRAGTRKLLVNLSALGHVDSSGVSALLRAFVNEGQRGSDAAAHPPRAGAPTLRRLAAFASLYLPSR